MKTKTTTHNGHGNILMTLSSAKLRQAADLREKIDGLQHEFNELVRVTPNIIAPTRTMSASARRKIAAAQRKRWRLIRAEKAKA